MIRRILGRFIAREDGAVLVIVAVGAVALVGMLGLAVDLGMLYTARSEAQRAADAAALAGASAFMEGDPLLNPELVTLAEERAYETAALNLIRNNAILAEEVTVEPIPAEAKVRVTIRRENIGLWFAPVLRITEAAVAARAAAEAAPAGAASPARCIKPFAIPDMWRKNQGNTQDQNGNQIWDLEPLEEWSWEDPRPARGNRSAYAGDIYRPPSDPEATGYGSESRSGVRDARGRQYTRDEGRRIPITIRNVSSYWQLWRMPGQSGTSDLVGAIGKCIPTAVNIGEHVWSEPGNASTPEYRAFKKLIEYGEEDSVGGDGQIIPGRPGDPRAYWDEAAGTVRGSQLADWRESARVMTVALYDPRDMDNGLNQMTLVDFALLFLEDPDRTTDNPFLNDNPPQHRPITGRLLKYTPGEAGGGSGIGTLPRILRLVE
jgi:hypothetical protein